MPSNNSELKMCGAGGAIRARDLWTGAVGPHCSPDYESGALARLGYPGTVATVFVARRLFRVNLSFKLLTNTTTIAQC